MIIRTDNSNENLNNTNVTSVETGVINKDNKEVAVAKSKSNQ